MIRDDYDAWSRLESVLDAVYREREAQQDKWGEQDHPNVDVVLLSRPGGCGVSRMAEHYELPSASRAKFMCEDAFKKGEGTYAHILVEEVSEAIEAATLGQGLRDELIQVAAVAVAWVEKLDREGDK